jgi:hypothetical protein
MTRSIVVKALHRIGLMLFDALNSEHKLFDDYRTHFTSWVDNSERRLFEAIPGVILLDQSSGEVVILSPMLVILHYPT